MINDAINSHPYHGTTWSDEEKLKDFWTSATFGRKLALHIMQSPAGTDVMIWIDGKKTLSRSAKLVQT